MVIKFVRVFLARKHFQICSEGILGSPNSWRAKHGCNVPSGLMWATSIDTIGKYVCHEMNAICNKHSSTTIGSKFTKLSVINPLLKPDVEYNCRS